MKSLVNFQNKNKLISSTCFSLVLETLLFGIFGFVFIVKKSNYSIEQNQKVFLVDCFQTVLMIVFAVLLLLFIIYFSIYSKKFVYTDLKKRFKLEKRTRNSLIVLTIVIAVVSIGYSILMFSVFSQYANSTDMALNAGWFRNVLAKVMPLVAMTSIGLLFITDSNKKLLIRISNNHFSLRGENAGVQDEEFSLKAKLTKLVYGITGSNELERNEIKQYFNNQSDILYNLETEKRDKTFERILTFFRNKYTKMSINLICLIIFVASLVLISLSFSITTKIFGQLVNFDDKQLMLTSGVFLLYFSSLIFKYVFENFIDFLDKKQLSFYAMPTLLKNLMSKYELNKYIFDMELKRIGDMHKKDPLWFKAKDSKNKNGNYLILSFGKKDNQGGFVAGHLAYPLYSKDQMAIFMNEAKEPKVYEISAYQESKTPSNDDKFSESWNKSMVSLIMQANKIDHLSFAPDKTMNYVRVGTSKNLKNNFDLLTRIMGCVVIGLIQSEVLDEK